MSVAAMLVLTTCGSAEEADELAKALVESRQAACVNRIDGVQSTYRWRQAVQTEREVLLVIKTTEARLAAIEATIRERTRYELPEFLAVRLETGTPAYLDWLAKSVAD